MNKYFVYILKCSDESYYTGITNNLERRINEHKDGLDKQSYTYRRRPINLKFYQEFSDVLQAIYFEKQIKGWSRSKKRALIVGEFDMLQMLAECRNATHYKYNQVNKHFDCAQCDSRNFSYCEKPLLNF